MDVPVTPARAPERLPVNITIAGRAHALSLAVRPLTVGADPGDGSPTPGHDGWSLALLSAEGTEVIAPRRMCGTADFWRPFAAFLADRFGAHLRLAISSTPTGHLALAGQCSLTLSADNSV